MEASIEAWLQQGNSSKPSEEKPPEVAAPKVHSGTRAALPIGGGSIEGGGFPPNVPVSSTARSRQAVVPLRLPAGSSARGEAKAASSTPVAPIVCPLCHGVSAEAELGSPTCDASPAAADSPSPPAGASPTSGAAGVSPRSDVGHGGERVQRRSLRKVKRGRSINKVGKWWKMYGYSGPPYCQRCSEVFRDHIIRQISNSANCSRANPCTDCTQVLKHLPQPHKEVWAKMDQTKVARGGARAAKQAKQSAAAVGLVQLSESYDGAEMASPAAVPGVGRIGSGDRGGSSDPGSRGHTLQHSNGAQRIVLPTLRASSLDGGAQPRVLPTLRASSLDGGSQPRRVTTAAD
jgi:hypothetical protein